VETWLMAYVCFACTNQIIEKIQIIHPFHGIVWEYDNINLGNAKELYETLLKLWNLKQK